MGTSGTTPPEANFLDRTTWIDKADYERTKSKAYGATTTATGLKGDITFLKAELAGVTALSLGYSLFKIDEKGVSYRGKMIYAAKYADAAKHLQVKTERLEERVVKDHTRLEKTVSDLTALRTQREEQNAKVADATGRRDAAFRAHRDYPDGESAERLRLAEKEREKELQTAQRLGREVAATRSKARSALIELKRTAADAERLRADFKEEKERTEKGAKDVRGAFTALENSINGVAAAAAGP